MLSKKLSIAATTLFLAVSLYSVYEWCFRKEKMVVQQVIVPPTGPGVVSTQDFTKGAGESVPVSVTDLNDAVAATPPRTPKQAALDRRESSSKIEAFTEPYRDIAVSASEMGPLAELKVKEGDLVKAGDVIAVMNDDVLMASLEVARRSMNSEGTVNSALADVNLKKAEIEKLRQLRERNHASQQEVDRIATELEVAEARLQSVREDLEVKMLEARRIEAQLEQRIIRAPIDGLITELIHDAGEFVSPSEPMIARLVQLDPLLIVFSVPLAQRNSVKAGQTVSLKRGLTDQAAEGVVEYVSPTPDSSNSSVRVKVRLPNAGRQFQSGESVSLVLDVLSVSETQEVASDDPSASVANGSHETSARQ
ncbi:MAG: efflux RND transporter periplasmic adaptor subunit [Planctomycetota bacterium]